MSALKSKKKYRNNMKMKNEEMRNNNEN